MRRTLIVLTLCCLAMAASAAAELSGKVVKVLPHYLDLEGRHTLSPSLYERDAYQAVLRQHPERRSGIGSIEQLDAATLADARAFHEAYYGPDTATLIVAGNFDMANLKALVSKYFAPIPRRANAIPLTVEGKEPVRTAPREIVATAPNVPLPVVGSLWKVPGTGNPDTAALEVLDAVMSSGDNGPAWTMRWPRTNPPRTCVFVRWMSSRSGWSCDSPSTAAAES